MNEQYINKLLDCIRKTENSVNIEVVYSLYDIDMTELNDNDKMSLIIMLYNMFEYGCKKKTIKKVFPKWSDYKIKNIAKKIGLNIVTLFDDEGHLAGRGYMFKWDDVKKFMREYNFRFNKNLV
jgi:hypothetical protein